MALTCVLAIRGGQAERGARKVLETPVVKERPCQKRIPASLALNPNHKTHRHGGEPTSKSARRWLTHRV